MNPLNRSGYTPSVYEEIPEPVMQDRKNELSGNSAELDYITKTSAMCLKKIDCADLTQQSSGNF
jgi:hypothetical protein